MKIRVGNKSLLLSLRTLRKPNIVGLQSWVNKEKDTHILMLDYDDMKERDVIKDITRLQCGYDLGDVHVFKTGKGYHAYCLNTLSFADLLHVIFNSRSDEKHKVAPFRKKQERCYTLRISEKDGDKPKYITTLFGNNVNVSVAHMDLFEKLFNIMIIVEARDINTDSNCYAVNYYQKMGVVK